MTLYTVVETCDDDLSINLITSNPDKARDRLYNLAVENEIIDADDKEKKNVMEGKITGYRDGTYCVELLECDNVWLYT